MNTKEAREIVARAKPIQVGIELKGFLIELNDFTSLLLALSEEGEMNEY